MQITVNNKQHKISEGATIAALILELGYNQKGVAVAIDNTVILRSQWENYVLSEGTILIIFQATQGG